MADLAQREQHARDTTDRAEAVAAQHLADEQQQRLNAAKAEAGDSRENHTAASALLALLALITGGIAGVLLAKDRPKSASVSGIVAAVGLVGGALAFFSRPSLDVRVPKLTAAAAAATEPLAGKLLCQVKPELSRITVSSTDDLAISWDPSGCMNGRTQYVDEGATWRRVLVPNGSETVFVQDFDPTNGKYISTRYLLAQPEMQRLRQIRGSSDFKRCASADVEQLGQVTDQLLSQLPQNPNERIVYTCQIRSS